MSSPNQPTFQKLNSLDRSLSGFHDQLSNALYGEEYIQCAKNLQEGDAQWLVDYLDDALDRLNPFSTTFRKCLRELKGICGSRTILPSSYTLSSPLIISPNPFASGGSGDVYRATLDDSEVCIKRVRVYTRDSPERSTKIFCKEAVMWKHLKHPNVVPLLGVTVTPPQLISEWMPNGDLLENVKKPNADRVGILSDVAQGLCYLHSCNVIHGDLKGHNILVDRTGHARIVDFGLAMVTQNLDSIQSISVHSGHTPRWTAPEVLRGGVRSKEADTFSFAMVVIEAFTGAVPFSEKPASAAMFDIMSGERPPRPTHNNFTNELWTLVQKCWNQDPHLRPTVSEVLNTIRGIDYPAWKSLINDTLPMHERVSLITMIFSNPDQVNVVKDLSGNDAQAFVDKIDEALDNLAPQIHRKCLRYLYETCERQLLVPKSLEIPLCFDPGENPVCHGGLADLWEGEHADRKVAAEVFRIFQGDDTEKMKRKFCREVVTWRALRHPNILPLLGVTITENRLVMVSEWMKEGSIMEYTEKNPDADRIGLLRGVTRGLIYMHDQRIIHGDLKGTNVLIDNDLCARLAGFDLVTIASNRSTSTSSQRAEGTIPWMSPELLYPARFSRTNNNPTMRSDCYALGMMIYEVLSGQAPFSMYSNPEVVCMVLDGKRPEKPQGDEGRLFTEEIWGVLGLCWKQQPGERPSAKRILRSLEGDMSLQSPETDEDMETGTDEEQDAPENKSVGLPVVPDSDGPTVLEQKGNSNSGRRAFNAVMRKFRRGHGSR